MMKCQWKEKLTKFKCWHLWTTYCFVEEVYLRLVELHKFKELQYRFMLQSCCNLQHQSLVYCVMCKYEEFSASRDANCFALIHCKNIIKYLLQQKLFSLCFQYSALKNPIHAMNYCIDELCKEVTYLCICMKLRQAIQVACTIHHETQSFFV